MVAEDVDVVAAEVVSEDENVASAEVVGEDSVVINDLHEKVKLLILVRKIKLSF